MKLIAVLAALALTACAAAPPKCPAPKHVVHHAAPAPKCVPGWFTSCPAKK